MFHAIWDMDQNCGVIFRSPCSISVMILPGASLPDPLGPSGRVVHAHVVACFNFLFLCTIMYSKWNGTTVKSGPRSRDGRKRGFERRREGGGSKLVSWKEDLFSRKWYWKLAEWMERREVMIATCWERQVEHSGSIWKLGGTPLLLRGQDSNFGWANGHRCWQWDNHYRDASRYFTSNPNIEDAADYFPFHHVRRMTTNCRHIYSAVRNLNVPFLFLNTLFFFPVTFPSVHPGKTNPEDCQYLRRTSVMDYPIFRPSFITKYHTYTIVW